jgi:hypothetical protein
MRFGGHETFAIREGWLHKGLKLLVEDSAKLQDDDVADWLGVGRNMGKSIKHWLVATGLAEQAERHGRGMSIKLSELGKLIHKRDPSFLQAGTWWALHVELANCQEHAVTWWWFFNQFSLTRFDRAVCLTNLRAHLELNQPPRVPAQKTLQRDIACLIATYATPIPAEINDPEDADDCPFRELRLMTYSRSTGACSLNTGLKPVPPELLGYSIARAPFLGSSGQGSYEVTLREAASRDGGPGKVYVMGPDALFELALSAEQELGPSSLAVAGLGAERTIRVAQCEKPWNWLEAYYDRVLERRRAA